MWRRLPRPFGTSREVQTLVQQVRIRKWILEKLLGVTFAQGVNYRTIITRKEEQAKCAITGDW